MYGHINCGFWFSWLLAYVVQDLWKYKVISTLFFVSLAAALALPPLPDKGTPVYPPPKNLPPPPSSTLPPPPKTDVPIYTPVPHSGNANIHTPSQDKVKVKENDNTHVRRGDSDPLPPKKGLPPPKDLPPPKGDLPPPPTTTGLPPPKTDVPPVSTPVPHLDSANTHQGKAIDNDKTHVRRGDSDPLPPKKGLPPKDFPPPKGDLPPPPKTTGLPPPKTDAPPTSTPVPPAHTPISPPVKDFKI